MLQKTIKAIQELDATVIQADATKKLTFDYINANYKNKSELMNQKIEEMNNVYNETCERAATKVRETLQAEVQEAISKVNATACAEVPSSFRDDLTVIQARKGAMSDYEVELYVNKYIHNYPATAALNSELAQDYAMVKTMHIVKPDALIGELEQRRDEILRLVKHYDPTSYVARLLRKENSPITDLATRIQAFVDGNFMVNMNGMIAGALPV